MKKSEGSFNAKSLMENVRARMMVYDKRVTRDLIVSDGIKQEAHRAARQVLGKGSPESEQKKKAITPDGSLLGQLMSHSVSKDFSRAADDSGRYENLDKLLTRFVAMAKRFQISVDGAMMPEIGAELLREWKMNVEVLRLRPEEAIPLTLYQGDKYAAAAKEGKLSGVLPGILHHALTHRPRDPQKFFESFVAGEIQWLRMRYSKFLREHSGNELPL